jgi:hypothetical protein
LGGKLADLGGKLLDLALERLDLGFEFGDAGLELGVLGPQVAVLGIEPAIVVEELLVGRLGHPDPSCRRDPFHRPLNGDRICLLAIWCG